MTDDQFEEQPDETYQQENTADDNLGTDNQSSEENNEKDDGLIIKLLNIAIIVLVIIACGTLSYLGYLYLTDSRGNGGETTPPPQSGDAWQTIQESGKLVVGTSLDYPPFEYYNKEYIVDGFDIALITEMARRWGVSADIKDITFDGLGNSVRMGNVNVAISAISVTAERETAVDFSNVYYVGQDAILATNESPIQSIGNIRELAQYTIGVQRGSVYADFVRDDMVATGLMPESNLFEYVNAEDAVRDLVENRVQTVMLDLKPAQVSVSQQPVKIVGEGLNQQRFAIALQKGQSELQSQLNKTLAEMNNDGTMARLAQQYLDLSELIPPDPPTTPAPTATPDPAVTPTPEKCIDDASFVQDLSYDDAGMTNLPQFSPGEQFRKGWRLRNSGTCTWDSSYRLDYDEGTSPASRMNGKPVSVVGTVAPGQTYDFFVDLIAPLVPGEYVGFWNMVNGANEAFGSRVWVAVDVVGPATPTPVATATPVTDISFTVNQTNIQAGQCVTFSWSVTNASAVYFYALGENWWENPVSLIGSKVECPPTTTTYELRVVRTDGSVVVQQIAIQVTANPQAPTINRFTVNPNLIVSGDCVQVQWQVSGDVSSVIIYRDTTVIRPQAPLSGQMGDCPPNAGQFVYKLEAKGPGGNSVAQETVSVTEPTQPTATSLPPTPTATFAPPTITPAPNTPTAVPPTATPMPTATSLPPTATAVPPTITNFSVSPNQIQESECVTVAWSVTGSVSSVQFAKNGDVVYETASVSGAAPDCSNATAGTVTYTITASNNLGQTDTANQVVTVTAVQPTPAPTAPPPAIVGDWQLLTYQDGTGNMANVISDTPLTASFLADNRTMGFAGCNSFNATYQTDGSNLVIDEITATKQSCPDPTVMAQETAYLANLADAASYVVNGDQMTLNNSQGQPILTYSKLVAIQPFGG